MANSNTIHLYVDRVLCLLGVDSSPGSAVDKFGLIVPVLGVRLPFCLSAEQIRLVAYSCSIRYQPGHLQCCCQGISV